MPKGKRVTEDEKREIFNFILNELERRRGTEKPWVEVREIVEKFNRSWAAIYIILNEFIASNPQYTYVGGMIFDKNSDIASIVRKRGRKFVIPEHLRNQIWSEVKAKLGETYIVDLEEIAKKYNISLETLKLLVRRKAAEDLRKNELTKKIYIHGKKVYSADDEEQFRLLTSRRLEEWFKIVEPTLKERKSMTVIDIALLARKTPAWVRTAIRDIMSVPSLARKYKRDERSGIIIYQGD